MDHYKRFGWTGLTSSEVKKKAKDLQVINLIVARLARILIHVKALNGRGK